MLRHLHKGKLACAATFQANWFAYVLWGIYECINTFFAMHLTQMEVHGYITHSQLCIKNCSTDPHSIAWVVQQCSWHAQRSHPVTPMTPQHNNNATTTNVHQETHNTNMAKEDMVKKTHFQQQPEGQQQGNENYWNENKCYNTTLKQTNQPSSNASAQIWDSYSGPLECQPQRHSRSSTSPPHFVDATPCGGCLDPACSLHHDDTPLNPNQINRTRTFLTDGAKNWPTPRSCNHE